MSVEFDEKVQVYIFTCPHCNEVVQVPKNGINCNIFRHGVYKNTMIQIPSHSTKIVCENLLRNNQIYGCGKPFIFDGISIVKTDEYK